MTRVLACISDAALADVDVRQRHGTPVDAVLEREDETRRFVLGQQPSDNESGRRYVDHDVERVVRAVTRPVLVEPGRFRPIHRFAVAFDASATGRRIRPLICW